MQPEKAYHHHGARAENIHTSHVSTWEVWMDTPKGKKILTSGGLYKLCQWKRQLRELDSRLST